MAKVVKRNLDSARRAPVRKQSYQAPSIKKRKRKTVPEEYRTLKKAPKKRGGSCLIFIFLIFVAALAGFIYWNSRGPVVIDDSLKFSVQGPDKIISGDQVTYYIEYENLDIVTLQQMELSVRWPGGFYFDEASVEPRDDSATTWLLEDLRQGETGTLEIKGQLVGQKDDELQTTFILGYQPENFHSDFKATQNIDTKITDSKIEVNIESVAKTLVEAEQEFNISFRNLTDEPLLDLYLDVLYPDDLEISPEELVAEEDKEESAIIQEGDYWLLNLEPDETKVMNIKGSFPADSKADQSLVVEVGNMLNEEFRRLARAEKELQVISPQFEVKLDINGSDKDQGVNWSDVLRYQLEVTNLSGADLADVSITALLDGEALNWDDLDTIGSHQENNIVWTKEEDEALATWPVADTKTFTWQLQVVDDPIPARNIENIIKIEIEGLGEWEQVTKPLMLTVGESLGFNSGVYWDLGGRQVGSGLLPPRVGVETQYLVVWSVANATGEFDQVSIDSSLAPQVSFLDTMDVQEGNLSFDEDTRVLTWQLDEFDDLLLPLTASFTIEVLPTEDDRGETITLLNTTTVEASGKEDVVIKKKPIKTSDVFADSSQPIGIIE